MFEAVTPYAQSPLHHFKLSEQARAQDERCGVWMNELALLGYIVIRGDAADAQFREAIQKVLHISLPMPHRFVSCQHGILLWQSPDEWLLVCKRTHRQTYLNDLEKAFNSLHTQVVDNTGGLTMLAINGQHHVDLLRHVGTYDFESIAPGQVINTHCSKVNVTVLRYDQEGLFVIFRRSFADYFWRLLTKSARPYGLGIHVLSSPTSHSVLSLL